MPPQKECLCQAVRRGLHLVGKVHAVLAAVAQKMLEAGVSSGVEMMRMS